MVERFAALTGCGNRHLQVLADVVLPDIVVERPGPQARFVLGVVVDR